MLFIGAMANPTPQQVRLRERFEVAIGLMAPVLNLVLAAGDRLSRVAGPEDEYYPIRAPGESFQLAPPPRDPEPPVDEPA
jgi:hypothetical protein